MKNVIIWTFIWLIPKCFRCVNLKKEESLGFCVFTYIHQWCHQWSVCHFTLPRCLWREPLVTVVRGRRKSTAGRVCLRVHHNSIISSQLREKQSLERCVECLHLPAPLAWLCVFICWFFFIYLEECTSVCNFCTCVGLMWDGHPDRVTPRTITKTGLATCEAQSSRRLWQTNCRLTILGWGCPVGPLWRHTPKRSISCGFTSVSIRATQSRAVVSI